LGEHFQHYQTIEKLQLLPYHKLGEHKWQEMGWRYELTDTPENTPEQIERARGILAAYFKEVEIR
jgi:pyruvate formate lyase activating enzyme